MECWQERVFYYWRHGLFGHVISLCEELAEKNKADLFLPLWATLAKVKQNIFSAPIKKITLLDCREDLKLLRSVCDYEFFVVLGDNESLQKSRNILNKIINEIPNANTFSKQSSAFISILFGNFSLGSQIIENEESSDFLNLRGWISLLQNNVDVALDCFSRASENNNNSCLCLYGKSMCFSKKNDNMSANECFSKISSTYNFPEITMERAYAAYSMENYDLMLNLVNKSSGTVSNLEQAYLKATYYLKDEGNLTKTIENLKKVVEIATTIEKDNWRFNVKTSYLFMSLSQMNLSIVGETMKLALLAVDSNPKAADAYFVVGNHQIAAKNYYAACESFDKGLDIDPISQFGLEGKLCITIKMGRNDEANDQLDFIPHDQDLPFNALELQLRRDTNRIEDMYESVLKMIKERTDNYNNVSERFSYEVEIKNERPYNALAAFRFDVINNVFNEVVFRGMFSGVSGLISKILKIAPGLSPLKFYYLLALNIDGEDSKAIDVARYMMISDWQYKTEWCLATAASSLVKVGKLQFAQKCIDEILETNNDMISSPRFLMIWAKVEIAKGKSANTMRILTEYFNKNEMPINTTLSFIDICINANEYATAATLLKQISKRVSKPRDKAKIIKRQALILAAKGQFDKSFAYLEQLKAHKKYQTEALNIEGVVKLKYMKDECKYLKVYEDNAEANKTPESYALLGDAYSELLMFDEAVAAYENVLKTDTSIIEKYIYALIHAYRFEKAVSVYKKYSPEYYSDTIGFVKLMIKLRKYEAAKECLNASSYLKNKVQILTAEYYELYGLVAMKMNDLDTSEQSYIKALAIYKAFQPTEINNCFVDDIKERASNAALALGHVVEKRGQIEDAIVYYKDALDIWGSNGDAVYELFKYYEKRDLKQCIEICSEYIMHNTDNETIALLVTGLDIREYDQLIDCLTAILKEHPKFFKVGVRYIELLNRAGKIKEGENYMKIIENDLSSGAHFVKGLYYMYIRNNAEAAKYFEIVSSNRQWGVAAKIAYFSMLINPSRKYIWDTKEPLASQESLTKANAYLQTINTDENTKLSLKADLLCSTNTNSSINEALSIYNAMKKNEECQTIAYLGIARCKARLNALQDAGFAINSMMQTRIMHATYSYFEEGYLIRSIVSASENNFLAAKHDTALAIKLNKSSMKAWEMSAFYGLKAKLYGDAATSFMKCWELSGKKNIEIGYELAYCLMMNKKPEESLTVCRAILDENPLYKDVREKIMIPAYRMLQ